MGDSNDMDDAGEDFTVSRPAGFDRVGDDPGRPGVRVGELVRNRRGREAGRNEEPSWLKWLVGILVLPSVIGGLVWALGLVGVFVLIGLAVVGLLVGIFVRMGRK